MKKTKKLVLLAVLVVAAMTSLPADSVAAKFCAYQYYYDAAHTQPAGYCAQRCDPNPYPYCIGEQTEYYALVDCTPACNS